MSYQLWKHQKEAIERAKDVNSFAFFFDVGTGKTAAAIHTLREWMKKEGGVFSTLVLCPPIVIRQWREEIEKYAPELLPRVVLLEGPGPKRLKTVKEHPGAGWIFVTNYETLLMQPVFMEFLSRRFGAMICDESHKLKNITAKRTKFAVKLSETSKRKLLMTGTPVLNTPMDLFSQFLVMDNGATFGKNFFVFRATYFYDKNAGMPKQSYFPDWRPRPGMVEKIPALIEAKCMKARKSDCLDLPPLVKMEVPVQLSKEQSRAYEEMKADFVAYIEDKAAVASMALIKLLRLQQIVSGFLAVENTEGLESTHRFEEVPRVQALYDVLEDIVPNHKVIVWACFKYNYEQIRGVCERLGVEYVEITGERTETQKREAVERFRKDDRVRVCIANQKAGGVGLNLIEASYSVYFSRSYSLEDDIQSEARNYRGGSERHASVTRIDLVSRGTVDDLILGALKKKQNVAEQVLALKKEIGLLSLSKEKA